MVDLQARGTADAKIFEVTPGTWHLSIPQNERLTYRWAQLDDYFTRSRRGFAWQSPQRLSLEARISHAAHGGTWGFGFWNDPFSLRLGIRGTSSRFPALPNCAWFFFAPHPNYLALRDSHPAQGMLAAVFSSPQFPMLMLAPAVPLLGLLHIPALARIFRKSATYIIQEDAQLVTVDMMCWHSYTIDWQPDRVQFEVDGSGITAFEMAPRGRLGLVIWIDNQYAAFPPDGKIQTGLLATGQQTTLEVREIQIADYP